MTAEFDPLRDFVEQTKETVKKMVDEANELDMAHQQGRIGDLIRKYNPRHQANKDGDDSKPGEELEGETGGPEVPGVDST